MNKFNAFITGSYAYGTPHEESDIDLVICMDGGTIDSENLWYLSESSNTCRFGKLNLIILAPDRFEDWKKVNDELMERGYDVPREEAVAAFQKAGFGTDDYGRCSIEAGEGQVQYDDPEDDPDFEPLPAKYPTLASIRANMEACLKTEGDECK